MWQLFIADVKMAFRNKQSIFWIMTFPLMFTLIFGLFFGGGNKVGSVAIINKSNSEIATSFVQGLEDVKLFNLKNDLSLEDARTQVTKSKLSGVVYLPETFGVNGAGGTSEVLLYTDPSNATVNQVLNNFVGSFFTGADYQIQGVKPIFKVTTVSVTQTKKKDLSNFDFIWPGLIGMALMNSSIIGIAISMTKYREDKILKRITTTPLPTYKFLVPEVLSRLLINFIQITLIILIVRFVFHGYIGGNLLIIYVTALAGALLFQLIGFTVAALTKTQEAAEGMATAITIPMMFLGGVFFPIDSLPSWLTPVVSLLPLAPFLRIIRGVALEAKSPFDNLTYVGIILGWIAITLAISLWRFRLTDEG